MLDKIKEDLKKAITEFTIEDFNIYTMNELYMQIANKTNEVIEIVKLLQDYLDEQIFNDVENIELKQQTLENVFNQLIINAGNSNAEIVDARIEADGTTHSKLRDRLNKVDSQIKDNMNKIDILKTQYVNVISFGAKRNIEFDNTQAFNEAMNYALTNNIKTIFIPTGIYKFETPITFKGNIHYLGYNSTFIFKYETTYSSIKEDNFIFEGITFDANNVLMRALYINNSQNFKIMNCKFKNGTKYGLHCYNIKKSSITGSKFENAGRNDFMSSGCAINGTNITVQNCEASGNELGNGFMTYSDVDNISNAVTYTDCTAKLNKQHGFITAGMGYENRNRNITFLNCTASDNGGIYDGEYIYSGIAVHDAYNVIISGCNTYSNKEHGICIMDSDDVIVADNVTNNNCRCGIRLQADWGRTQDNFSGVKKAIISNNQCIGNGIEDKYWSAGILIEGNCHYITCNNNMISSNYYSIFTKNVANFSDCTNIYLQHNIMYNNKISDNWFNTMSLGSVFGENFIAGVRTKIDTVLKEQAGYIAYNLTDKLDAGNKLNVENNAMYHVTTGNIVINGVTNTSMPVGTTFYICLKTGSDQHSITINTGNGISLPSTLVINKANGNNELIFKFIKTIGTGFRLLN